MPTGTGGPLQPPICSNDLSQVTSNMQKGFPPVGPMTVQALLGYVVHVAVAL